MESLVDVVICDFIDFDSVVFECWLDGLPPKTALSIKINGPSSSLIGRDPPAANGLRSPKGKGPESIVSEGDEIIKSEWMKHPKAIELLQFEIFDQYRTYDILGHYIRSPQLLSEQTMVQLDSAAQAFVIQKYYELNDDVVREILARKLAKNRKDLDEIADIAKCSLRRVTRQVDNIKRMFAAADDIQFQCNLLSFVESQYTIPHNLARKYVCILFIMEGKFSVNSKKRMQRVSMTEIETCACVAMACLVPDSVTFTSYWNPSDATDESGFNAATWSSVWQLVAAIETLDPDRQLLASLRELKGHLTGDKLKDACNSVRLSIQAHQTGDGAKPQRSLLLKADSSIKTILKNMIVLGANLSLAREFRDIFEDIVTKIGEPLEEAGLNKAEALIVLECCVGIFSTVGSMASYRIDWMRFVTFCKLCLGQLYSCIY